MSKGAALAVLGLAAAACASARGVEPVPIRAADFRPAQIRQPAFLVRLTFAGQRSDREREALPVEYEGALLEGLNARAVLARDVQVVAGRNAKLDARAALERARALGADHAIVVDVRVSADEPIFCRGSRRPFRAPATVWSQSVQVLRTTGGSACDFQRITKYPRLTCGRRASARWSSSRPRSSCELAARPAAGGARREAAARPGTRS